MTRDEITNVEFVVITFDDFANRTSAHDIAHLHRLNVGFGIV